jgi:hypothetical protein
VDRFLLFPLLAPIVLLAAGNDGFAFDPAGYLDSFTYIGYFWHYPEHLWVFDDNANYKISRLPWIIPGYVLHTLTGPIAASFLLAYVSMVIGAVALYLISRDAFHDRGSGAVVGVAWACCTWAHGNGGWNYHVLMAAGYYLMGCWLIVRAAQTASRWSALAAGVFLAAAVHTHLFLVIFAPIVVALHVAALPPQAGWLSRSVVAALQSIAGGILLTVVLSAINAGTGGTWQFFMPQIEQALKLTNPDYDHWWIGNASQWLPRARYLVLPLAFLAAGLTLLFRNHADPNRRLSFTVVASAWAAFGVMCYFQFGRRQTTLDYSYMAFALYPPAFLCLIAALSDRERSTRAAAIAAGWGSAAILGALLLLLPRTIPAMMDAISQSAGLTQLGWIVPPLLVSVLGAWAMQALHASSRVIAFAVWFSIVNAWIAPAPTSYGIGTAGYHRSMLLTFREADRVTTELDPTLIGIKYWLSEEIVRTTDGEIPSRYIFDSFLASRAWLTNLLGRKSPSPSIDQLTLTDLDRGACIGILSTGKTQGHLQQQMKAHFAGLGRPLREVASRRFEADNFSFALTVLKPVAGADQGPPCMK